MTTTCALIRTLDDVEWPAPGRWSLDGRQLVTIRTRGWRSRTYLGTVMGELVIDEDPARSTLALTVTAPDGRAEVGDVRISAALTYADAAGEWYFTGSVRSPRPAPVALHVRYLGVYRRAHRAMASLRISAELPRDRRRSRLDLDGALDVSAPEP